MKILHLLLVLVALGAISATRAQNADEPFAPKVPPSAPPPALPENSEPAAADTDNKVVVPELKGLVFIGDRSAIQPDGVGTEGVEIVSLPLLATPGFRAQAAAYIGRPLNLHLLNQLTREVVLYFRQHDRPIVDVSVPEQNISAGAVQILVLEGRLGRVRVEGNHWFSKNSIARDIRQRPGKPITGAPLLEDIAWLNQNPFRHVDLVFEKGAKPGETDIVLRTQDRLPVRVFADYEDSGTAQTGRDRLQAGINWGDAFGRNQQMSYQITGNPDFEKLVEHSISYVMPIPALRQTLSHCLPFTLTAARRIPILTSMGALGRRACVMTSRCPPGAR